MICGALTIAFNAWLLHRGRGEGPRGPQRQFKGMPIPPDTTGINARPDPLLRDPVSIPL
jgi:hypothetical protein